MQGKDIGRKTMKIKHATLKKTLENVFFFTKPLERMGCCAEYFFVCIQFQSLSIVRKKHNAWETVKSLFYTTKGFPTTQQKISLYELCIVQGSGAHVEQWIPNHQNPIVQFYSVTSKKLNFSFCMHGSESTYCILYKHPDTIFSF